jgi:ABC-type transporter Mla maintaining outer membrane lipid asymmetry ATPase subunit MlaF
MNTPLKPLSTAVIELENVSIGSMHGGDEPVIEDIHWRVGQGEFWVVAGHHGSGKSDLLLALAGLMAPLAGDYRLGNAPLPVFGESHPDIRLKVGLVFNGGRLLNHLSVVENVALPVRYHEDTDEAAALDKVAPILDATGLVRFGSRMPGTLGRHWCQRAGLARALATRPDLLLLDDPLSGLDSRHAAWWVEFLGDLSRGRPDFPGHPLTLIVVTGSLAPWRQVATHCALLEDRRLMPLGCLSQPDVIGHPRIREFLAQGRWAFDPGG